MMENSAAGHSEIAAMSEKSIARTAEIEAEQRKSNNQIGLKTQHFFHGGIYRRVVLLPKGAEMVGALIKIPTTVIVIGDVFVWIDDGWCNIVNSVLTAGAMRKQRFFANEDTYIHMLFPTSARTVEEAEREFTSEFGNLLSRRIDAGEETIITGE